MASTQQRITIPVVGGAMVLVLVGNPLGAIALVIGALTAYAIYLRLGGTR